MEAFARENQVDLSTVFEEAGHFAHRKNVVTPRSGNDGGEVLPFFGANEDDLTPADGAARIDPGHCDRMARALACAQLVFKLPSERITHSWRILRRCLSFNGMK